MDATCLKCPSNNMNRISKLHFPGTTKNTRGICQTRVSNYFSDEFHSSSNPAEDARCTIVQCMEMMMMMMICSSSASIHIWRKQCPHHLLLLLLPICWPLHFASLISPIHPYQKREKDTGTFRHGPNWFIHTQAAQHTKTLSLFSYVPPRLLPEF